MDYIEILQEMLRYIDLHITEKLSVEILAARAGFSPYHFCRVFQWEAGIPVMEYVRNRRLAFAASELSTGRRIIDIAADYGFETHSGFSKAFRRYFGCPPEKYRMHAAFGIPKLPILEKTKKYVAGGIVMEPKLLPKASVKLAGFCLKTTTRGGENKRAIPAFWTELIHDGRLKKLHGESFVKEHPEYGACIPLHPENGDMEYLIGVEVNDGAVIPGGYETRVLPEALYAVFTTPPSDEGEKFVASIQGTWGFIYSEWFPNSGYEFDGNGVDFELYDDRCMAKTGKVIDIYIPVVKKRN